MYLPSSLSRLAALFAIVCWAFTIPLTRVISEHLSATNTIVFMLLLSGGLALIAQAIQKKTFFIGCSWRYFCICGALFGLYEILFYLALAWSSSRMVVLEVTALNYLWPILAVLFSRLLIGNKHSWTLYPGLLISLVGVALAVGGTESTIPFAKEAALELAHLLAILGALAWALYSALSNLLSKESGSGGAPHFMIVTAVLTAFFFFEELSLSMTDLPAFEMAMGAIASASGYFFWDYALREGDYSKVSSTSLLAPLLSSFVSCLSLSVFPQPFFWIGALLLVGGVALSRSSKR